MRSHMPTAPNADPKGLYLVISGAPAPEGLPALVKLCQENGWRVVVVSTPMGLRFADVPLLEEAEKWTPTLS
jgi:hypothetical protein